MRKMKRKKRLQLVLAFGIHQRGLDKFLETLVYNIGSPVTEFGKKQCVVYAPVEFSAACPCTLAPGGVEVENCWIKWLGPKNMKILKEIYE